LTNSKNKTNREFNGWYLLVISFIFVFTGAQFSVFESTEYMGPVFLSDSLGSTINLFFFASHFILSGLYMKLFSAFASVPWYEIILYTYLSVSFFIILHRISQQRIKDYNIVFSIKIFLVVFLFIEPMLFLQYTRIAFALGSASTILYLTAAHRKKKYYWLIALTYSFAFMTRPEVGVFIIIMQWLIFVLIIDKHVSKTPLLVNTAVCLTAMLFIVHDRMTTNDFIKKLEPELCYQLLERGNIIPLSSMTNKIDSVKYTAVVNGFFDPKFITIDFLQSLVNENAYVGYDTRLLVRAYQIFIDSIKGAKGILMIYLGLLLASISLEDRNRYNLIRLILLNLTFWTIIVLTIYLIKMEQWVFHPMLTLMCFILATKADFETFIPRIKKLVIVTLFILGAFFSIRSQQSYYKNIKAEVNTNILYYSKIAALYSGKIIMPAQSSAQKILNHFTPFITPNFSVFQRIYLYDSDVLFLVPDYNTFLSKECKCDAGSYSDFLGYLASKNDSLRYISTPDRVAAIENYCRIVRCRNFDFIPIDTLVNTTDELEISYKIMERNFAG
jgi:hypothetical protein